MQNKNIFDTRSQYLEIVKELYLELSKSMVGEKFPWFLIRIQTAYFFHLIYGGKIKIDDSRPVTLEIGKKYKRTKIKYFLKKLFLFVKIKKSESVLKNRLKNKTLYLGYNAHNIKNGNYNIYLHPFLEKVNGEIFYLDAVSNDFKMQKYYNDLEQYYKIKAEYIKCHDNCSKGYLHFSIAFLKKRLNISLSLLQNNLASIIDDFSIKQEISRRFIKTLNPQELFFYCYYDSNINAMLSIANEYKIKTTEYQHSSITNTHFAYAKWEITETLTLHFPQTFYVWENSDKELILNNFSSANYRPEVQVVGNKYLQKSIENSTNKDSDSSANILICLQGQWIPKFLEDFILEDENSQWYFRLHPRYPQDNILLQEFALKKKDRIIIEKANMSELYDVFAEISVLMTSFSGTAVEAEKFGKRVIIFGEEGYNSYLNKIETGAYNYIEKVEDLNNLLF